MPHTKRPPMIRPHNARFSSGPCAKRPGWAFKNLETDIIGRSHRSEISKERLLAVVEQSRALLDIPADYKIGITAGSDTGAMELAMWNLIGAPGIGVDVFAWEQFSLMWMQDVVEELRLKDVRSFESSYGDLPDLSMMDRDRDAIFVWNGTTSGARVPSENCITKGDKGLRICDATSAVFAYEMPWDNLDVVTWSWQKVMGGEAQHGMIVLSPKALARLESYQPEWPMPKIFQLRQPNGKANMPFFEGVTLNTPSMMCVADVLDAMKWIADIGGRKALQKRVISNAESLDRWVQATPWIDYLTQDVRARSLTSVCLRFCGLEFQALNKNEQTLVVDHMVDSLEREKAGYDLKSYKTAPLGLRIWCGGTVETRDIEALCPWLEWTYHQAIYAIKHNN